MRDKLTWFYEFDKEQGIEANRYFATISILFAALVGAIDGAGNTLNSWFGWSTDVSMLIVLGLLIHVYGINLTETIMASKNTKAAVSRAVVLLIAIALAWLLGKLVSILVLLIVAAWVMLCAFTSAASEILKNGGGSSTENNDPLKDIENPGGSQIGDEWIGKDGLRYRTTGWGSHDYERVYL